MSKKIDKNVHDFENEEGNGRAVDTESFDEGQEALAACQQEVVLWKDKFLRANADFKNFKQRVEKEQVQWIRSGQALLLADFLAIVDDIDRALFEYKKYQKEEQSLKADAWIEGFELISKSLYNVLEKYGVTEITDLAEFNPEFHEALVQIDSPDYSSGEIVEVLQKGFKFKDEILRPAKVSVAK